jgi:hypothetical protein
VIGFAKRTKPATVIGIAKRTKSSRAVNGPAKQTPPKGGLCHPLAGFSLHFVN